MIKCGNDGYEKLKHIIMIGFMEISIKIVHGLELWQQIKNCKKNIM